LPPQEIVFDLSLAASGEDLLHFPGRSVLDVPERLGKVLDLAPMVVHKISRPCFQVFERAVAFPFFPVQAKQQFRYDGLITICITSLYALGGNTPLCL
jgi:hypothetical protein